MKMTRFFIILLTLVLGQSDLFGHGTCKTRNSCNWTVNTEWQYKAHARVTKFGWPKTSTDKDCPYTTGDGYAGAYVDNGCANQGAYNNAGSYSYTGSVYSRPRICARGFTCSELYYDIASLLPDLEEGYERSNIETSQIIFDEQSILVDEVTGFLEVKGEDLFSSFEVIMWLPENELDESITPEKTFFSGKLEVFQGRVNVSGDFPRDMYEIVEDGREGVLKVRLIGSALEVMLPKGVSGKNSLIEVVGISDGGVREADFFNAKMAELDQQKDLGVVVGPNPTSGLISVQLLRKKSNIEFVRLYNAQGKLIETFEENQVWEQGSKHEFQMGRGLASGNYFLVVQMEGQPLMKKIAYLK